MPSRGTKTYAVRLAPELVAEVQAQIDSRNSFSAEEAWDLSAFIRVCLKRELKKMARSRKHRPGRRKAPHPSWRTTGTDALCGEG